MAAARRAQADWGTPPADRARLLFRLAQVVAGRADELAAAGGARRRAARPAGPRRPVRRRRAPAVVRRLGGQAGVRRLRGRPAAGRRGGRARSPARCPAASGGRRPRWRAATRSCSSPTRTRRWRRWCSRRLAAEAGLPDGRAERAAGGSAHGTSTRSRHRRPVLPVSARLGRAAPPPGPGRRSSTTTPRWTRPSTAIVEALGDDQRVLVAESVADEFGELLRERLARLRVGDPRDHNTDSGRWGSRQRRRPGRRTWPRRRTTRARAAGTSPAPLPERGWFLAPTVFADVGPTMRVAREEIPGPLLPVLTFRTPAEAVATRRGAARRRGLDGQGQPGAVDGAAAAGGRVVGERGGPVGPGRPARRPSPNIWSP